MEDKGSGAMGSEAIGPWGPGALYHGGQELWGHGPSGGQGPGTMRKIIKISEFFLKIWGTIFKIFVCAAPKRGEQFSC